MDTNGMVLLLNYREDGITRECNPKIRPLVATKVLRLAYFTIWKDGVKEVKL